MITGGKAISMHDFDVDPGDSNCSKKELIRSVLSEPLKLTINFVFSLFKPGVDLLTASLLRPLKRMKPSEFELMVIAGLLLWSVDGRYLRL
jgi:hypothetical protein